MSSSTPKIYFERLGERGGPVFWGHGWGQNHAAFMPMVRSLEGMGQHWALDFPGFGQSPLPPSDWGTAEYADAIADFIKSQTSEKIVWVGHSFGCRVGLQLAARHPELIGGLFLIAAAGLPRVRNPLKALYFKARIRLYKLLKKLIPFGLPEQWLLKTFASRDYLSAGPLKNILVKTVNENLSEVAATITCPVVLFYGTDDTETPPDIGQRLAHIIPHAELVVLSGFDHYTILDGARHQVVHKLNGFIKEVHKAA
jgi:pimeloyl-ACP methyl ester carboxylesterase